MVWVYRIVFGCLLLLVDGGTIVCMLVIWLCVIMFQRITVGFFFIITLLSLVDTCCGVVVA